MGHELGELVSATDVYCMWADICTYSIYMNVEAIGRFSSSANAVGLHVEHRQTRKRKDVVVIVDGVDGDSWFQPFSWGYTRFRLAGSKQ